MDTRNCKIFHAKTFYFLNFSSISSRSTKILYSFYRAVIGFIEFCSWHTVQTWMYIIKRVCRKSYFSAVNFIWVTSAPHQERLLRLFHEEKNLTRTGSMPGSWRIKWMKVIQQKHEKELHSIEVVFVFIIWYNNFQPKIAFSSDNRHFRTYFSLQSLLSQNFSL